MSATERGLIRLVVIQVLVLSLFVTLIGRLWYLQVWDGDDFQAQASSQSVREIVVQPPRGLIVDSMGRAMVSNRTAWVVSVDRTLLGRLEDNQQRELIRRTARALKRSPKDVRARLVNCTDGGAVPGKCWNGSPFQPVPIANDVKQQIAMPILEQAEDYPSVLVERQTVRSYPSPFGINAAHTLGYLSPITADELAEAEDADDETLNGASLVGRAGLEQQYDAQLRGVPGAQRVSVDSRGRVLGDDSRAEPVPGNTLVTSMDAKVQGVVEKQLQQTIQQARQTVDSVTGKPYVADAGAAVVLEAKTGRVVAMASQPTYNPEQWVGGISQKKLDQLYSEKAGTPLLSRVTQGQFAPGSTWKPFMTAGALGNGYDYDTRLNCSSAFQVGNRAFKNYESGAYGFIGFDKALEVSCNTFFYQLGYNYWLKAGGGDADVDATSPLMTAAKEFGFGSETGIDLPSEASGRLADREWKQAYYEAQKDYYCSIADENSSPTGDYHHRFAREFCIEGYKYRAGDAVNFAIGQGDTTITPLQLARAYGALGNGGKLYEPQVAKAVLDPSGEVVKRFPPQMERKVDVGKRDLSYIDKALKGVSERGTMSWRLQGFPLDEVSIRSKTGSAEVYGKQSTSWIASYSDDYVVVMMVSQGGTGSGTSGPAVRKIWEALYGVQGEQVKPRTAALPGGKPVQGLPRVSKDGAILPPRKANR